MTRDLEAIKRRYLAGIAPTHLAREFHTTPEWIREQLKAMEVLKREPNKKRK